MGISDIVKAVTPTTVILENAEPFPCRMVPVDKLKRFSEAADLLDIDISMVPQEHPLKPGHYCLALQVCSTKQHAFFALLDEEAAFGLTAIYCVRHVNEVNEGRPSEYMTLLRRLAKTVEQIQARQEEHGVKSTSRRPVQYSFKMMYKFGQRILEN